MSKPSKKRNANEFDSRIRWYALTTPAVLTISQIGIESIPDLYATESARGEIVTTFTDGEFDPYAPKPARKKGEPIPTKEMPVLWFRETGARKSLVLNSTNRRALIEEYGADFDAWKGKVITLARGKTRQGKNTVILEIGNRAKEHAARNVDTATGEIFADQEPTI